MNLAAFLALLGVLWFFNVAAWRGDPPEYLGTGLWFYFTIALAAGMGYQYARTHPRPCALKDNGGRHCDDPPA